MKRIINRIEALAKDRPVAFWIFTIFITSVPVITFSKQLQSYLLMKMTVQIYQFILAVAIPCLIHSLIRTKITADLKSESLKRLKGIEAQLNQTFSSESSNFPANGKTITKYYHYEILECFDDYNDIIEKLKSKWQKKYKDFHTLNERPQTSKGNWVYENEMAVVKSNVLKLKEMLK